MRVQQIITKVGELVNVVAHDVRLEMFVRGKLLDAVLDASAKVDRALRGASVMIGADVAIGDVLVYQSSTSCGTRRRSHGTSSTRSGR